MFLSKEEIFIGQHVIVTEGGRFESGVVTGWIPEDTFYHFFYGLDFFVDLGDDWPEPVAFSAIL